MSSTTAAQLALAEASINRENYESASPHVWERLRKFRSGNTVYRDFEAINGLCVARVIEVNSRIESIVFLEPEHLISLHIDETSRPGRPWVDNGKDVTNLQASEFAFGIAKNQQTNNLQLMITPASYFIKHGELWPYDLKTKLIPRWLNKITNGLFQSNTSNIQELKQKLITLGFIETDQLSDFHKHTIRSENYADSNEVSI